MYNEHVFFWKTRIYMYPNYILIISRSNEFTSRSMSSDFVMLEKGSEVIGCKWKEKFPDHKNNLKSFCTSVIILHETLENGNFNVYGGFKCHIFVFLYSGPTIRQKYKLFTKFHKNINVSKTFYDRYRKVCKKFHNIHGILSEKKTSKI